MTAETDTLVKPDMVAVLQRTHVSKDLHGFLLPTPEAVSNAMHGIEARFGDDARKQGTIGDCQEFCAGGRLPSLDDEALTEDYGELTFGLTPFARWALPFVRRVIEHEI